MKSDFICTIQEKICYGYLLLMFSIFLFVFHDGFYDITISKHKVFFALSILFIIMMSFLQVLKCFFMKIEKKRLTFSINKVDIFMVLFALSYLISTFLSNYKEFCFNGHMGRYIGLYSMLLLILIYFFISRYFKQQQSLILVFLFSVSFVQTIGILNFLGFDIFGVYRQLSDYQSNFYLSTIGNANFFAILTIFSLPIVLAFFLSAKEKQSIIIYYVFFIIDILALLSSNCDGVHVAIIVCLIISYLYSLTSYKKLLRFIVLLMTYLILPFIFNLIANTQSTSHYFYTISALLIRKEMLIIFFCVCLVYSFLRKNKDFFSRKENYKLLIRFNIGILVFIFLLSLLILILVNVFGVNIPLIYFDNYFKFDSQWGTGRGSIWTLCLEAWRSQDLLHKLFGAGPETIRLLLRDVYNNDALVIYDNAHNEYLHYLVTVGLFGLISYLGIAFYLLKNLCGFLKRDIFVFGLFVFFISYFIQAIVNISQPSTTPILFIFIGIAVSITENYEKKDT